MRTLPETDIYAITDSELSLGRSSEVVVGELLNADVKIIQYREKNKSCRAMLEECIKLREMTRQASAFFIVNDHIAIARLVNADGVHIGQDDLPVAAVRQIVGDECVIGLSTHSPEQAAQAVKDGANYIGVGPIYATQTKKNVCAPVGLEYLEHVVQDHSIPFVAIGGIKEHNIREVVSRGAKCCCLVSELVGAVNIQQKVAAVRLAMR